MPVSNMRTRKRFPVSLFVNQQCNDRNQTLCMSLDLSAGGMTLISLLRERVTQTGRHAWFRFRLPGQSQPINALGEVVHRRRDEKISLERTGLRFKFLFPDQRRMLEQYLAEVATGEI